MYPAGDTPQPARCYDDANAFRRRCIPRTSHIDQSRSFKGKLDNTTSTDLKAPKALSLLQNVSFTPSISLGYLGQSIQSTAKLFACIVNDPLNLLITTLCRQNHGKQV